jgi:hypothetical protein
MKTMNTSTCFPISELISQCGHAVMSRRRVTNRSHPPLSSPFHNAEFLLAYLIGPSESSLFYFNPSSVSILGFFSPFARRRWQAEQSLVIVWPSALL